MPYRKHDENIVDLVPLAGDPEQSTNPNDHTNVTEHQNLVRVDSTESTESNSNGSSEGDLGTKNGKGHNKALFRAAARLLKPGPVFRFVVYLYCERTLLTFFCAHFIATMVIWTHFAMIKLNEQLEAVPEGAPFYWLKTIAPTIEFGSMHAILFQTALIPLTMSRNTIASLSGTVLDRFVPLDRSLPIHIYLGFVMVSIVFLATIFFFIFFGLVCAGGDQSFCDKFTSEIMITGYCILGLLLIVAATAYFRHQMPYELFYAIHHLVFIMYAITILHTVDDVQRNNERNRSQTFRWFSATIVWYLCDRLAMRFNNSFKAKMVSASAVSGGEGSRMLFIRMTRPVLFQFRPGQYVFLKQRSIDHHWHPFSIASSPSSRYLEFYVEVFGPETWTGKLWDLLKECRTEGESPCRFEFDVMGPYGTIFAKTENFSHGLVIGSGTGIVPILSLFKQHVDNVLKISPQEYLKASDEGNKLRMEQEKERDMRKGSFVRRLVRFGKTERYGALVTGMTKADYMQQTIRQTIGKLVAGGDHHLDAKKLHWSARKVTMSIYGVLFLALLSVLGVTTLALTISWNCIPIDLYKGMATTLKVLTVIFQVCFAVPALFVWDGHGFFPFLDFALCLVCIPANIVWFRKYDSHGTLGTTDVVLYFLLIGYMTARLWVRTVCPRFSQMQHGGMKRLEVVWVSRSAALVSEILPDINQLWDAVVEQWGLQYGCEVVRFTVYCTDKSEARNNQLVADLAKTSLYEQGFVRFGRPDFASIIEGQTLQVIEESRSSNTLIAFCGSPKLAETIHQCQVSNYMLAAITGHKKHQMEFFSQSYGGDRKLSKKTTLTDSDDQIPTSGPNIITAPIQGRRVSYILEDYSASCESEGVEIRFRQSWSSMAREQSRQYTETSNDDNRESYLQVTRAYHT